MREQGFKEALAQYPEVELVDVSYSQSQVDVALRETEDMLTAHPDLDGIFAANEPGALGAAQAIKSRGQVGKVKLVAFDAAKGEIDALREGTIQALIVQNPFQMGYQGVKLAVKALQGKKVPKRVDTGVTVVTQENLDDPEIRKLLHPPQMPPPVELPPDHPRIAVVPKGTIHDFWVTVHVGAETAARELGVEVIWKGPPKETLIDKQIEILEDFINQGIDAIVMAACDSKALVPTIQKAVDANIPVITIDSGVDSDLPLSFVATDNVAGARRATEVLIKLIKGEPITAEVTPSAGEGQT